MSRTRLITAIALPMMLLAAACGSDDSSAEDDAAPDTGSEAAPETEPASDSASASEPTDDEESGAEAEGLRTTYPLTFETCGVESTLEGPPESIVVYYEFEEPLLIWGLGDTIQSWVTFVEGSTYPGLSDADYEGISTTTDQPSREAILEMSPDLIVTASDFAWNEEAGFLGREDLNEAGIATWLPESLCAQDKSDPTPEEAETLKNRGFDQVLEDITELGVIVDRQAEAAELVDEMSTKMAEVEARVPEGDPVRVAILVGPADGSEINGVYTGGTNEDIIERVGGFNPFVSPDRGQYTSFSAEELVVTPLDVIMTDATMDPGGNDSVLGLFPTWPAAEQGRIGNVAGLVGSSPGLPWSAEQLFELLYPEES
ncbi:MAG: ABC transporter substrate-binding protein [Actinomycetota bacterium]